MRTASVFSARRPLPSEAQPAASRPRSRAAQTAVPAGREPRRGTQRREACRSVAGQGEGKEGRDHRRETRAGRPQGPRRGGTSRRRPSRRFGSPPRRRLNQPCPPTRPKAHIRRPQRAATVAALAAVLATVPATGRGLFDNEIGKHIFLGRQDFRTVNNAIRSQSIATTTVRWKITLTRGALTRFEEPLRAPAPRSGRRGPSTFGSAANRGGVAASPRDHRSPSWRYGKRRLATLPALAAVSIRSSRSTTGSRRASKRMTIGPAKASNKT